MHEPAAEWGRAPGLVASGAVRQALHVGGRLRGGAGRGRRRGGRGQRARARHVLPDERAVLRETTYTFKFYLSPIINTVTLIYQDNRK